MTRVPDLWWSPSKGLFHRSPGEQAYRLLLTHGENLATWRAHRTSLPEDAVRLCEDFGADYIRVGELISTQDRSDTYRLANGPQAMYLEPVNTGEGHIIQLAANGWTIKHPLSCRPNLFACRFNRAAVTSTIQHQLGRFECTLDDAGHLVIGREVS